MVRQDFSCRESYPQVLNFVGERVFLLRIEIEIEEPRYLHPLTMPVPVSYIHTGNFNDKSTFAELNNKTMTQFLRTHYKGILIACGSYSLEEASEKIQTKQFDLIAIGRPFIANPDLIKRIKQNNPLTLYDASLLTTLY